MIEAPFYTKIQSTDVSGRTLFRQVFVDLLIQRGGHFMILSDELVNCTSGRLLLPSGGSIQVSWREVSPETRSIDFKRVPET